MGPSLSSRLPARAGVALPLGMLALVLVVAAMPAVRTVTTPRGFAPEMMATGLEALWEPARAGLTLALFALCGLQILVLAVGRRLVDTDTALLYGAAMAFALGQLSGALLGQQPALRLGLLTFPLVFTALLRLDRSHLTGFLWLGRCCALAYLAASLALVPLWPSLVLQDPYLQYNLLPVRLHGLVSHANQLGALVALYLACDLGWARLTGRGWTTGRLAGLAVALAALLLSQSKTIWLALAAALLATHALTCWQRRRHLPALLMLWVALLGALALIWSGLAASLLGPDESGTGVATLTGRTAIWDFVLALWRENPWFGYGPRLLTDQTREELELLHGFSPYQAHNQWVQILGEAGLAGLAGQLLHVGVLTWFALRYGQATGGASVLLLLVFLIRSVTEQTLDNFLFSETFLMHFFLVGMLIAASNRGQDAQAARHHLSRPSAPLLRNLRQGTG